MGAYLVTKTISFNSKILSLPFCELFSTQWGRTSIYPSVVIWGRCLKGNGPGTALHLPRERYPVAPLKVTNNTQDNLPTLFFQILTRIYVLGDLKNMVAAITGKEIKNTSTSSLTLATDTVFLPPTVLLTALAAY